MLNRNIILYNEDTIYIICNMRIPMDVNGCCGNYCKVREFTILVTQVVGNILKVIIH